MRATEMGFERRFVGVALEEEESIGVVLLDVHLVLEAARLGAGERDESS